MNTENTFRLIATLMLVGTLSVSIYFRRKADRTGEKITPEGEGRFVLTIRLIVGLTLWFGIFSYMLYPPLISWAQVTLPNNVRWLGVGMMAAMLPLLYWMFSSLDTNITKTVAIREEHQLITHGPYKYIRHPLYTFAMINFIGLSLVSANLLIAGTLIAGMLPLIMRTPIEEEHLISRFGDEYHAYIKTTGRYWPKLN
jgi:protein-S-isoprenylcysteine O-methyltransferase Ste14